MRILALAVVVIPLFGCGLVGPTNAFDPDAPLQSQARASVSVSVVDLSGKALVEGVSVDVEGAAADFAADLNDDIFQAVDLVPGSYTVVVAHPAFVPVSRDIELGPGTSRDLQVVLSPLGDDSASHILGNARKESQVVAEAPDHSGVVVEVLSAGVSTGLRAITNAEGRYDLSVLAGSYSLSFTAPEHEPQTRDNVVVAVSATLELEAVTLEVNPGSIDGTVLLEDLDPADGVTPSPAGATISLVRGSVTTTAAADGSFRLSGLPPGNQQLRFSFASHTAVEVPVVVRAGSTAAIATVTLARERGVIFGVVEVTGAADPSAVLVEAEGAGGADVTGIDGSFSLSVPSGTYDVTASKLGARRARAVAVVVSAGAVVDAGVLTLAPNVGLLVINDDEGLTNDADVTLVLNESDAVAVRASEDPAFANDAFISYPIDGRVPFTLSSGDGDKTVFVQVKDGLGDVRQLQGDVVLDTTAPVLESVVVDDGDGLTTSLSITVSVLGSGADEMAVATDGTIDSEVFSPFAPTSIALLSSSDGDKRVCVALRDRADNRAGPVCVDVQLETSVPVAPRMKVRGEQDVDVITVTPVAGDALRVIFAPFGGPSADVVRLEGSIESRDAIEGAVRADVNVDCAPIGNLVICDDNDGVEGVRLPLFTTVDDADPVRLNSVVFHARDKAGNLSGEATLLVVVDDKLPLAPTPTNAFCATPGPGLCADNIYEARTINADSFTLRLREQPDQIDRTFTEYLVAQTVGDDVAAPDPRTFEPTSSVDNIVFALVQGAPLNGLPVSATCNPLSCNNHLFIVAIDDAGNSGPVVRVDVTEDSSPPTRPLLAPQGGLQRGNTTLLRLAEPARDRNGSNGDGDQVAAYEIKEGIDGSFEGVPDGQPTAGPWELQLLSSGDNEVCVRGVDSAGNVGIEDCVLVEEGSVRHPFATEQSERRVALAGDLLLTAFNNNVAIHTLSAADITDSSAASILVANLNVGRFRSAHRFDRGAGVDVVDVLIDKGQGGSAPDQMQVFLALTNNPAPTTRRSICGNSGDTDGLSFAFVRGSGVFTASRAQVQAQPTEANPVGCGNVGAQLAALPAAGLCSGTAVRVDGNVVVWCEGAGTIKRSIGGAAPVTLGTGALERSNLLQGSSGHFQQPQVTSTATFFTTSTTLRRVPHSSTIAADSALTTALVEDAEGDKVAYLDLTDDGVSVDVFVADFSKSPATRVRVTDDLGPQSDVAIDGDRVAFVDFASLSEDIGVADLSTSRWVAASPGADFQTAAGTDLVVWVGFDAGLAVFARSTGGPGPNAVFDGVAARLDFQNPAASLLTFFGGTVLGPPTVNAAGRNVLLLKKDAVNFTLRAINVDDGQLTPVVLSNNVQAINAGGEDATAAYGASPDGGALAFVDGAAALRFGRLSGASLPSTAVLGIVLAVPVPFVDTELVGDVGTTVAQLGNSNGDVRRTATGALTCVSHNAAGAVTTAAATVLRGGVPLVGRAPVIADVGGKIFMAYQEGAPSPRNRVCELNCGVVPPTCSNDVALGISGDGPPRISRQGLVAWLTFSRSSFGDVAVYDVTTDRLLLLTGVDGEEAPRSDIDVNGDRVIWSDGRLGDFDVWESVRP